MKPTYLYKFMSCEKVTCLQSPTNTLKTSAPKAVKFTRPRFSKISLAVGLALCAALPVMAATDTWNGGGSDNNWSTSANWDNLPVAGDSLIFGGSTRLTPNNDFTAGTAFEGISFASGAGSFTLGGSSILLSGQADGNIVGIANNSSSAQTNNLALSLDWGYYTFGSPSGALALNGTLTRNAGSLACFGGSLTSSSLTEDGNGLISGLGGAGLMMNSASVFTNLATVSGGSIQAYDYSTDPHAQVVSVGGTGVITSGADQNVELANSTAQTYTLSADTLVNTVLTEQNVQNVNTINLNGHKLTVGTVGGFFATFGGNTTSGNKNAITLSGGAGSTISAGGPVSGTPGTLIFGVNGGSTGNQMAITATGGIVDNGSGAVTVIKTGSGSMYFNIANSYSGGTYVDQGYLQANNAASFGTGPVYIASGATIFPNANGASYTNDISISPGLGVSYNANVGAIKLAQAAIILSGKLTMLGDPVASGPGCRITANNNAGIYTLSGQISGTGTLDLNSFNSGPNFIISNITANANNWTGGLLLDENANSSLYVKLGANSQLASNNVTLVQSGTGVARLDLNGHSDTMGGLIASASANNQLDNYGAAPAVLTIGANGATAAFGGVIADSGSPNTLSLVKAGSGTQTLSGANTYTGNTIITGGKLALSGSGAIASSPNVNVSGGTFDVSGASAYAATSAIHMTNGTLNLGNVPATAVSSLAVTNSTLAFPLNQSSANITVTGALVTGGSTNVINLTTIGGFPSYPGQVAVIKYGSFADVDANNVLTNLGVNLPVVGSPVGYLTNNVANGSIDLVLTSGPHPAAPITWKGQTNGVNIAIWDILGTSNWVLTADGVTPYFYQDGSAVTFDDSLTGPANVNLTTTVLPASVTFNNNSTNYVISGTGYISGTASLTLSGTADVTLDNSGTNDFSGGININSGTLHVGNNDANGNLPLAGAVNNNSALVFNRSDNALNLTGVISGSGPVTNNGIGTVTLSAVETFTGQSVVNTGILALAGGNHATSTLSTSSGLTINNGGTVQADTDNSLAGSGAVVGTLPVTINAGGVLTGLATADNGAGTSCHIPGSLTLNGGTLSMGGTQNQPKYGTWDLYDGVTVNGGATTSTINALDVVPAQAGGTIFNVTVGGTPSGIDLLVSGSLINGTSTHDTGIALIGDGVMALDNNNTYAAGTSITAGTLQVGTTGDAAALTTPLGTGGVDISGGAFLKLASSQGVTIANAITDSGSVLAVSGTNILSGTNTFSGNTMVTGGKLVLSGAGNLNASASVTVSVATLDVSGMSGPFANTGSLSLTNGMFNLGTNLVTALNSLSVTNTTIAFAVRLGTTNFNLTGTLATGGTTNLINITSLPGLVYPTNITLIKYGSADPNLVDGNNNLTSLGVSLPAYGNPSGYLTNNQGNSSIDLVLVSGAQPIVPITWTGETNSVNVADWNILGTSNWVATADGVTPYYYQDGSAVTFNDSAAGTTSVNLSTALSPASLTVSNASKSYTFGGSGKISGSTGLVKTNSGTVTFNETGGDNFTGGITTGGGTLTYAATGAAIAGGITNNAGTLVLDQTGTFTGNTTIAGGTLQVGNNDANGVLPSGAITNNASLVFKRTDSLTTANVISGSGSVTHNGTGTNLISGVNSYSGATAINAGTVVMGNDSAFGTPSASVAGGDVTVASGATLDLSGITAGAAPGLGVKNYNIAGTGVGGIGAVVNNGTTGNAVLHGLNNVTLTANATIGGNDASPQPGTAVNSGEGRIDVGRDVVGSVLNLNGHTLTKVGNNMVNFAQYLTTTTAGDIVWNGGVLSIDIGATIFTNTSAGSYIIMDTNTILETFHTPAGSVLTPIVFNGSGITAGETAGASTGTIDSSIAANSTVSFVERNAIANGIVLLNGPISDVSGSLSTTLAGNPSLPAVPAGAGSITVNGTILMLAGTNTYTGPTVVTNGTLDLTNNGSISSSATITVASGATLNVAGRVDQSLMLSANQALVDNGTVTCGAGQSATATSGSTVFGSGTVTGNLSLNAGSIMSPGAGIGAVGTLTVSGTANLQGTNYLTIDKSQSPSNDVLVANTILRGGTLTITNVGPALAAGDSFTFLSSGIISGTYAATNLPALTAGLAWTNNTPGTWSVVSTSSVNLNPTNITTTVSGNQLILSWPGDHTGWYLQAQTNSLGRGLGTTNWVTIPNSNLSDSYTNTVDKTQGTVFYRMVSP